MKKIKMASKKKMAPDNNMMNQHKRMAMGMPISAGAAEKKMGKRKK